MPDTTAAVITALIVERPLCLDCIAKEVALSLTATETALNVIQRALEVRRGEAPCRACGARSAVFSMTREPQVRPLDRAM